MHVVYGGAHLFTRDTPKKLGARAREAMERYGADDRAFAALVRSDANTVPDDALDAAIAARVRRKLESHPVEALCIDFEDGFGPRSDEEEDAEADRAGAELAVAVAEPGAPILGVRIKSGEGRGPRTLERFLRAAARSGRAAPATVTLPKVASAGQVRGLAERLDALEAELGLPRIGIELMIEAPRALVDAGALSSGTLAEASDRVVAVHLGAYDLTAELGVTARDQRLDHPFCDLARMLLRLTLAGSSVRISDGATTTLPIPPRGASTEEATKAVHGAWSLHARNVARAIDVGIWQGWDLHPAQLPARYGALYAHFLSRKDALAARWTAFREAEARATRVGQAFDDAATGRGLAAFFARGRACGAFDDELAP